VPAHVSADNLMNAFQLLADLRKNGWRVIAHNDYISDDGEPRVFWAMIHEATGIYTKAQGATDNDALQKILHGIVTGKRMR
jgi:hypothetical protein